MMLSIIIPVYNAEKSLPSCIKSIIAQSYTNYEVVLVDDGSLDNSFSICKDYSNKFDFIHSYHQENRGVSATRNKGIEISKGEYILFVDSDDMLVENVLENIMGQINDLDLLFLGSHFCQSDNICKTYSMEDTIYVGKEEIERGVYNLIKNPQHPDYLGFVWNKIFKADIIKSNKIQFVENLRYREDEIFTIEYANYCNSIGTSSSILYYYNMSPNGLTSMKRDKETYILLTDAYKRLATFYKSYQMKEYIALQSVRYTLDIIKKTYSRKERNKIIESLWIHNSLPRDTYLTLNVKHIYGYLLNLSSPLALKYKIIF